MKRSSKVLIVILIPLLSLAAVWVIYTQTTGRNMMSLRDWRYLWKEVIGDYKDQEPPVKQKPSTP